MVRDLPLTALLRRAQEGDAAAADDVYAAVYDELRRLARGIRARESSETLDTTALVHEAWIKLEASPAPDVDDRIHFKRIAGRAMRQVLVDQARARNAEKRGGGRQALTLVEALEPGSDPDNLDLIELDDALARFARVDARAAAVVECRFFGGMDVEETASALGISPATVKRDWRVARAWLANELSPG